ncbi:ABC transporter substrate-binding protein [Microtetraspora sp. NBRC 16547]|uniref:ABC transporter substrate-binding protein n=1 Tax=Microtetraspora sp. NBRC 16547 TaxID=3030993 RepID=UPI0024A3B8F3|nr:ABC transporter substrate-binding protein [Microtetraspora sp. NBRC 16547]GLW98237.1 ABC transporter substrate-binding protein [Microtetraspora sp. NBRC 16547]
MLVTSRGRLLAAAGAALTLLTAACGGSDGSEGSGASADKKLTFTSYGSGYQQAQADSWLTPWAKREGVTTVQDQPTDYAKIKTMVDAGRVTWDVVDTEPYFPVGVCGTYAEKLDFTKIDKSKFPPGTVSDCAVPDAMYSLVLVYNKDKYGANPPTSTADFFDTAKFPGKRLAPGFASGGAIEAALIGDGVAKDQLYPLDYDRAFRKLDSIKKDLTFWDTSAQSQQALESKQADMALIWSGRAYMAAKNGAPYKAAWKDNMLAYAVLMVPKGAPHKDLAMSFIAYATGAEPQATFAEKQPYAPINIDAKPQLDDLAEEWNTARDDIQQAGYFQDAAWWGANMDEATKRWTAWTTG